jgi:RNA polymerase sigma factor (TIGR02999 family)
MSSPLPNESLTSRLRQWRQGDGAAFESVIEEAYEALRVIARQRLRRFTPSPTLSATDVLHEALAGIVRSPMDWQNRAQFFATMSLAMRSVLVDHVRAKGALKRGGDRLRVTLNDATAIEDERVLDIIALDEALNRLESLDARGAAVLHLTYFAGLERKEIAEVMGVSVATIDRSLRFSRAWLKVALGHV